jgi:hypothetical protein
MRKRNLSLIGVVLLIGGIGLAIYGYTLEPTFGEAVTNIFDGDFTQRRNLLMLVGIGCAVLGGVALFLGSSRGKSRRRG